MENADKEWARLAANLDRLAPAVGATSNISVNAGGIGTWVAVTACLVVLAVTLVGSIYVAIGLADLNRQTQELRQADATLQAYINVGYQQKEEAK